MTLVEVLCLNHGLKFGTVWASTEGEMRVEVCEAANHRMFHFYGGMNYPYLFAWLYSRHDLIGIKNRILEENKHVWKAVPKKALEEYLAIWHFVKTEGFYPEFFIPVPFRQIGINYEKLPKIEKPVEIDLHKIITGLTIEKDPYFPEPKFEQDDFEEGFQRQVNEATLRTQACVDCQFLDRSLEKDFFNQLIHLQSSPLLEQRWITLLALHFYLRGGINDSKAFKDLAKTILLDDHYLIRKETFELLKTSFLLQPKIVLSLISKSEIVIFLFFLLFLVVAGVVVLPVPASPAGLGRG